jgi:methylated-DNA-[protein]-cysteine S-methyltransferase
MKTFYTSINSPVGRIYLHADDRNLLGIYFESEKNKIELAVKKINPILKLTIKQLNEYFELHRTHFDLPLKLLGTDFQIKVWKSLQKIPYGKTKSYGQLASTIGNPKAYRAVGTANGKNNFPIIIPCHRVIKSTGAIGEYSGGDQLKKTLLNLEKKRLHSEPLFKK